MDKIIHIITGLEDGGAEGVLYRLCENDNLRTHIVISLVGAGKYGHLLEENGVEVHYLNLRNKRSIISDLWRLFWLIRMNRPTKVQTWMYHADLIGGGVARIAGISAIFWNVRHSNLEPGKSKKSTVWIANACAFFSRWVPKRIIYCAYEAKVVHENLGYIASKSVVIGNGYNLNQFRISESERLGFRRSLALSDEDVVIGMVGRYDPQKDHSNLLDSICIVKGLGYSLKLVLVGRDLNSLNSSLLRNIEKCSLTEDVVLLGQRNNISSVMNGLDIHVLSSSYGEAFPNVLAEAMACGTPCVTTRVGDAARIVGNTGWVVPPKESQSLASAIVKAIEEKQNSTDDWLLRKKACRNHIYSNFGIQKMIDDYCRVWDA